MIFVYMGIAALLILLIWAAISLFLIIQSQIKIVRRIGFGDFYGCENYPQCKFKKKLDD